MGGRPLRAFPSLGVNSGAGMVVTGRMMVKVVPTALLAGNPDLPPMAGDNPLRNRQPQSGPSSFGFGGKKGIKDIG